MYASNADKYAIKGNNLIIGSTELIMNHLLNQKTPRIETAVASKDASVKKISIEKFISGMETFSFLINASIVLAKQVLLTNKIINKNIESLEGKEKQMRELSIKYYKAVFKLNQEYEKRKLPWLNDLVKKYFTSLNYKRGEAFCRSQDSITIESSNQLSDKMIEYPRGSIICEENTAGEEMYILQTGSIDVEIGGNRVATIDKQGTVIGEMALLLNEKRTATLKAKNNTVITVIKKKELKEVCEKQSDLLKNVTYSLAQKHYYNIIKISTVNRSLIDQHLNNDGGEDKTLSQVERLKSDLAKLKNDVSETIYKKDAEFLKPVLEEL
jgi:CRP-like cAMP-binding protein